LQVFQQVGLAGAKIAGDEDTLRGGVLGELPFYVGQRLPEPLFYFGMGAAQDLHGIPVGHSGPQRLDSAPACHLSIDAHK
jgi:hypothetical protein